MAALIIGIGGGDHGPWKKGGGGMNGGQKNGGGGSKAMGDHSMGGNGMKPGGGNGNGPNTSGGDGMGGSCTGAGGSGSGVGTMTLMARLRLNLRPQRLQVCQRQQYEVTKAYAATTPVLLESARERERSAPCSRTGSASRRAEVRTDRRRRCR